MELASKAYGLFEVKALDEGKRTFRGWATTPSLDRVNDVINPMGVKYKNPMPLLHQHHHSSPIGTASFKTPTKKGIEFDAEIPVIEEDGLLKDRVDLAWGEIKYGLVRAVSIGFRALKYAWKDDGGIDYQEIEVYELSSVTIPALPDAVITSFKSMGQVSRDVIQEIKSYDVTQNSGGIALLKPKPIQVSKSGGAVKLLK
jgi:HK97 family phage prohead protease